MQRRRDASKKALSFFDVSFFNEFKKGTIENV